MSMPGGPEFPATEAGWAALFWEAFTRSRNAMALVDGQRRHVEINGAYLSLSGYRRSDVIGRPIYELVVGGPLYTETEWQAIIDGDRFTGAADMICADGGHLTVQFAGNPALVTGEKLVLFVAIRAVRAGRQHHELSHPGSDRVALSRRELEVIQLLALGYSGPEAAHELHLTHNTVRTHVRNAMAKVGARSRAPLVAMALGEGVAMRPAA